MKLLPTQLLLIASFLPATVGWVLTESPTASPVNTSNVVPVECSDTLREFTAVTDMILTGRSTLLSLLERKVLKGEFMGIYNELTTNKCDSYHRKVNVVAFLEQSNGEEVYTYEDMVSMNVTLADNETRVIENWFHPSRKLQGDANSTTIPDVTVTYEITGTCRECPITKAGSFELYDDAFRRTLLGDVQFRTRLLEVRELQDDDKSDCVCVEGVPPTPQAPGVQECVDLMNERLPVVQDELGVLTNLRLENLVQLDDLSELEESVEIEEEDVAISKTDPLELAIWGKSASAPSNGDKKSEQPEASSNSLWIDDMEELAMMSSSNRQWCVALSVAVSLLSMVMAG